MSLEAGCGQGGEGLAKKKGAQKQASAELMEMRYVQEMNKHLLGVKQTALGRLADCLVKRIALMGSDEQEGMQPQQILTPDFRLFLKARIPVLKVICDMSTIAASSKTL